MTIEDYPIGLVGLAALLLAVVIGRVVLVRGCPGVGNRDSSTGNIVLAAKERVTRIDRNIRKVSLSESSVFSRKSETLDTQDISAVSIRHGKGKFMHSGLLAIESGNRKLVVSCADILPRHSDRLNSLKGMIEQWLL